jgi:hypothetical protein
MKFLKNSFPAAHGTIFEPKICFIPRQIAQRLRKSEKIQNFLLSGRMAFLFRWHSAN